MDPKLNTIMSMKNLTVFGNNIPYLNMLRHELEQGQRLHQQQQQQQHYQQQQQQQQLQTHHQQQRQRHQQQIPLASPTTTTPAIPSTSTSASTTTTTTATNGRSGNKTTHQNKHPVATDNKNLIDLVTCRLCQGYLIDAATLDLCMHSFCRPCAVKYIRDEHRCPVCKIEIKDKRFLNRLKTDVTLQNIVYKLVPGLYENEMARRRKFYAARPSPTPRYKSEMFGDIPPSKTIKPDDMLNISITWLRDPHDADDEPMTTYFLCRADSTIAVIKKLIIMKFGLERPIRIYYKFDSEIFFDLTTLMDVAATFNWSPENKVLDLSFKEFREEVEPTSNGNKDTKKSLITSTPQVTNSSPPKSSVPDPLNGP